MVKRSLSSIVALLMVSWFLQCSKELHPPAAALIRLPAEEAAKQLVEKQEVKISAVAKIEPGRRVVLHATLTKTGEVKNIEFVSGNPKFLPQVVEAVRHWKYKPSIYQGEPVELDTTIEVRIDVGG
jgi:TonB-like protein